MPANGKKAVVITGADYTTGLGTARALRRLDVQRIGLCTDPEAACCRSHAWSRLVTVGPRGYLETLIELGSSLPESSVLFPSSDDLVILISDNRDELQKYYEFVLPAKPALDSLMSKTSFHLWCAQHGFLVPESHSVRSQNELDSVLDMVEYPVVVKPLVKTKRWTALSRGDKVFKLCSKADLQKIGFDLFQASPEIAVQHWVPGGDADVHFCMAYYDRRGRELGHFTGRKLLQWPLGTGSAAVAVGTDNGEVHRLTQDVFREARYRGLGSIEVKQSVEDKKYYLIEATVGRNDLDSPIALAGGVNLTLMAYYDALGSDRVVPVPRVRKSVWINEYTAPAAMKRSREFKLRRLLGLSRRRMGFAFFSLTDPAPFFHLCKEVLRRKLSKHRMKNPEAEPVKEK